MAHVNERLGGRACPLCGAGLVVRKNPAETLTISCTGDTGCDFSGFAKKGTKAARLLAAGLTGAAPAPGPAAGPAAAPAAKPTPAAPAARTPRVPFSMDQL